MDNNVRFEIESNGIWEYRKKKLTWAELCDALNELDRSSNMNRMLLEDIRHELASISMWYAFEPTSYINTEKEGHTIVNNKEFLVQLDFEDLIKRIDKELKKYE